MMDEKWLVFHLIQSLIEYEIFSQNIFIFLFRLSRCLLASSDLNCLEEMLKLVSIMSVDTIFLASSNMNEKMKMQRQKFTMNEGDHLTLLNVFKAFLANKKTKVNIFIFIFISKKFYS